MNLEIDKSILDKFTHKIKIFFYESGCSWTKINITDLFEEDNLEYIEVEWKKIFFDKKDKENLEWWKVFLKKENDSKHSQNDKYLFVSPKVKERCSCSTSFSFEKKLIDKEKLKKLQIVFKK